MDARELLDRVLRTQCRKCGAEDGQVCWAPELLWAPTPVNQQHAVRIGDTVRGVTATVSDVTPPTSEVLCPPVIPAQRTRLVEVPMLALDGAVGFDIETASADQLFLGGQHGPYVRLVGWIGPDGIPHTSADPADLIAVLNAAPAIYGHNIFGFDLLALARHCGADYDALAAKALDTLPLERLIDPPLSKGMPSGYYGLDALAQRLGHQGKTDDLKGLAKKHGGYDRIPVDDPEYDAYLHGDLAATYFVFMARRARYEADRYAWREMEVVALQNRMALNGWRVDPALLARRVAEEDAKRAAAVQALNERFGVPMAYPDSFKPRSLKDWAEPRVKGRTRTRWSLAWRHSPECMEDGESGGDYACAELGCRQVPVTTRTAIPTVAAVRRYVALFPEAAVERGYADRVPGREMKSPWATRLGKDAIIKAFADAGALTPQGRPAYPKTKTGDIALGKNELGEETWYCNHRRKSFPGMLKAFGHLPEVRELVELILTASGARIKYAEVAKFVTAEGRVHAWIGAAQGSGRWAHTGPSITNMGARGEAIEERAVLISDDGCIHVTGDLSTADVRGLAILSQDPVLIDMLQPGKDYHTGNAVIFFGDPARRKPAKAIGLGAGYGQGAKAIAERNGLDQKLVQDALDERERKLPVLAQWTVDTRALGASGALLDNGFGRKLRPDPERSHTQSLALPGQSASRDLMTESILRLVRFADAAGINVRPMLRVVVHDELVLDVPEALADQVSELLHAAMTWEMEGVPILCDLSTRSTRWSECVEVAA